MGDREGIEAMNDMLDRAFDGDDFDDDTACTHCGGEGLCMDGADPLGNCPDEAHRCHACGGSGRGSDQTLW